METQLPEKGGTTPIFGPCLLWPNGWMHQITSWYRGRPYPRRYSARWGPSSISPKGTQPIPISGPLRCGQTAGWTKMPLGMEVGLSPGDFVLDEDPAPLPQKGAEPPPQFLDPFLLWPNGWMHQDATWHGGRRQPRRLCVR